jgi:hypothetical protein
MKVNHSLLSILFLGGLVVFLTGCTKQNQADASKRISTELKFFCDSDEYKGKTLLATVVKNTDKNKARTIIDWDMNNNFFGEKWTPQKRCQEVSQRLHTIYERDQLKYIIADEAKWITDRKVNVVCSVKNDNPDTKCEEDDLLFTLETKDNPDEVVESLIAIRNKKASASGALRRGSKSQATQSKRVYYDIGSVLEELEKEDSSEENPAFK